ncbi:hypothetical protein JL720_14395 [Aureococcus anophagefferens]|nr:hypothetical protein JL720_14395 [Aureococcus anophagefferens]
MALRAVASRSAALLRPSAARHASDAPRRWPPLVDRVIDRVSSTTGLHELTQLKDDVAAAEAAHEAAVQRRSEALAAHDAAVQGRASTQSELAVLLQRRDTWDAADRDFIKAVQRRYHGELLWQEKYRALSLYSTWALIGVNSVIFLGSSVLRTRTERERMDAMSAAVSDLAAAARRGAAAAAAEAEAKAAADAPAPPPPRLAVLSAAAAALAAARRAGRDAAPRRGAAAVLVPRRGGGAVSGARRGGAGLRRGRRPARRARRGDRRGRRPARRGAPRGPARERRRRRRVRPRPRGTPRGRRVN